MIDMDEVIVKGRFTEFIDEFLGGVDFEKLNGFYRQDLIKGREEEFKKIQWYLEIGDKELLVSDKKQINISD